MTWIPRSTLFLALACAGLAYPAQAEGTTRREQAGAPSTPQPRKHQGPRTIEIRWNMNAPDEARALEVWENCDRTTEPDIQQCALPGQKHTGTAAFGFALKDTDRVVLVLTARVTEQQRLDAQYAITGVNVDDKAREALKRVFGPQQKDAAARGTGGISSLTPPKTIIVPVTDDLLAGGRLTATFKRIERGADGKETVLETPDAVFKIGRRSPWFVMSYGLALVNAPDPSVEIIKTNNVISFEKDGKPQQAFEQVINVKDADNEWRPIETAVAFLNFRLRPDWLYASGGFVANETIFTQPLLGVSGRIPMGNSLGLMVTAGVRFTKETEITADSGFTHGQKLDPTIGLTVGDIPTTEKRHRRFFIGLSFDF